MAGTGRRKPKSVTVPPEFNKDVSKRLRAASFNRGYTAKSLAAELGIAYNTVLCYMLGDRVPTLWRFKRICEALEVDPAWMLGFRKAR